VSTLPNLFLVGAPKCGTTALAEYLSGHPNVFLAFPKEPNYFARHLTLEKHRRPDTLHTSLDRYLELFQGAEPQHSVIGEASTRYIRSRSALEALREFNPAARSIVMLRNPVDLVQSWHGQKLFEGQEDEREFEAAWRLQARRSVGECLPAGLVASDALDYAKIGSIGSQLEVLFSLFARDEVHVIFFDDFRSDPKRVYEEALRFLGLRSDRRTRFPLVNQARTVERPKLARALKARPVWLQDTVARLKRATGLRDLGMTRFVDRLTSRLGSRKGLTPGFRRELVAFFEAEVSKIEKLTGRDLESWRH